MIVETEKSPAPQAPDRPEHRQREGPDRAAEPRRVDLQLPLRHAARDGRHELRPGQGDRRRRDGVPRRCTTGPTASRPGISSSPAARSSTTSTTRSRPTTRTGRPGSSPPRPAAAGRHSGPVADPQAVHRRVRLREDGPGRQGHRPRRPRGRRRPGRSPSGAKPMRSTSTEVPGSRFRWNSPTAVIGPNGSVRSTGKIETVAGDRRPGRPSGPGLPGLSDDAALRITAAPR